MALDPGMSDGDFARALDAACHAESGVYPSLAGARLAAMASWGLARQAAGRASSHALEVSRAAAQGPSGGLRRGRAAPAEAGACRSLPREQRRASGVGPLASGVTPQASGHGRWAVVARPSVRRRCSPGCCVRRAGVRSSGW